MYRGMDGELDFPGLQCGGELNHGIRTVEQRAGEWLGGTREADFWRAGEGPLLAKDAPARGFLKWDVQETTEDRFLVVISPEYQFRVVPAGSNETPERKSGGPARTFATRPALAADFSHTYFVSFPIEKDVELHRGDVLRIEQWQWIRDGLR